MALRLQNNFIRLLSTKKTILNFTWVTRERWYHKQAQQQPKCVWKEIHGFSKYEASTSGLIRFKTTGRVLKGCTKGKFQTVNISKDTAKPAPCRVDRLIMRAFLSVKVNDSTYRVIHLNGNDRDNRLPNLKWVTHKELMNLTYPNGHRNNMAPVEVSEIETGHTQQFESIVECNKWMKRCLGLKIHSQTLRERHNTILTSPKTNGKYKVSYLNHWRKPTEVENIDDQEVWKLFAAQHNRSKIEYYVSNYGRVKRVCPNSNMHTLKRQALTADGYNAVSINIDGQRKNMKVHRLVCQAFVVKVESCDQVDHIDGIRTNNNWSNLRWVKDTYQNMQNNVTKARFHKRRIQIPVGQINLQTNTIIRERLEKY